jgi:hypothetical protein
LLITELLIKIAPAALHELFSLIARLFKRPGAPFTTIEIPTEHGQMRLVFDPKTTPIEEMVNETVKLVRGELYLTTRKSTKQGIYRESMAASELKKILSQCRARSKVIILDCCYSGSFTDEEVDGPRRGTGPLATTNAFAPAGTFILMANGPG